MAKPRQLADCVAGLACNDPNGGVMSVCTVGGAPVIPPVIRDAGVGN